MNESWCQQLEALMQQTCAVLPKSEARRRLSDRLIRHLQSDNIPYSQSYDRDARSESSASPQQRRAYLLHQEAVSQTWLHFLLNLCECQTQNTQHSYVSQACIVVKYRLRKYYHCRLLDLKVVDWERRKQEFKELDEDGNARSLEEFLIAPADKPDWLDELCQWLQADESGILRQTHLRNKPQINAQVVLLRRLCANLPWAAIAEEFEVPQGTLAPFFQNRCLLLVRKFLEEQGYIDPAPPLPMMPENPNMQMDLDCWLETDPTKQLRNTHLQNRPDITAQLVLLRQFKSQDKLKDVIEAIATENNLRPERLKAFYYRKCKPLLAEFGKRQGYSEE
ncbi:MAG: hypothetical protein VKK04_05340 [Synechococcales bacterium]|nr:hypothetical protein [Synechococcales bacterium]